VTVGNLSLALAARDAARGVGATASAEVMHVAEIGDGLKFGTSGTGHVANPLGLGIARVGPGTVVVADTLAAGIEPTRGEGELKSLRLIEGGSLHGRAGKLSSLLDQLRVEERGDALAGETGSNAGCRNQTFFFCEQGTAAHMLLHEGAVDLGEDGAVSLDGSSVSLSAESVQEEHVTLTLAVLVTLNARNLVEALNALASEFSAG